jgi:hypothetical protein
MLNAKQYWYNLWIGLDHLINAALFGAPDETLSGRMGRYIVQDRKDKRGKIARVVCKILNAFDKNHCVNTYRYERSLGLHRPESLDDEQGD